MSTISDLVACFSKDAKHFAFQANASHKNTIDIYPLDPSSNNAVSNSSIGRIDYETNDLVATDIIAMTWCSGTNIMQRNNSTKSKNKKRKNIQEDDENISNTSISEINNESTPENVFINCFSGGKIVVFSSNGKNIINIIQNKNEISNIASRGSNIWILDDDKTVKKFIYYQSKPLKTFHLIEGKKEVIKNFQVLPINENISTNGKGDDNIYISLMTESRVIIIDPSKRRPTTVSIIDVSTPVFSSLYDEGKKTIIADANKINLFEVSSGQLVKTWDIQVKKFQIVDNTFIIGLTNDGNLVSINIEQSENNEDYTIISNNISKNNIIEFAQIPDGIIYSWLNVNEPNFEMIQSKDFTKGTSTINANDDIITSSDKISNKESLNNLPLEETQDELVNDLSIQKQRKKINRTEQDELSQKLLNSLEGENSDDAVTFNLIVSEDWIESRIKIFIIKNLNNESNIAKIIELISREVQKNSWQNSKILFWWLKWLLSLKNINENYKSHKHNIKNLKHIRSSLKPSTDSLPILLSMQGRLELLTTQSMLREQLANLNIEEQEQIVSNGQTESQNALDSEKINAVNDDNTDDIVYMNGESDTFFDAPEYVE
ncbi:hypothetical protein TBLA_0A10590 [Henningerozyma blattae CBS 6284]|uniref:Small-subunit processome Utp12 domain-containing protein n=1 Tax=Henningerozyma blattae (strain ATCC 34711 / CBS 6284 / DSM 70876 / NBRC 10599 / NRRL Y-10934 / UCD 77-7) TaxID=1071380 RepID=I2GXI5_HENB6|nr:hypothetical protein TBLA_0A10590 [Tetrapisispora blattae CBS 6284]CCH58837.1 hypothetical protein TBLA_0A10590 [Tetrapisispora blattae CBS 6284]